MKILHVYSGNLYGGIETLLRTLAESAALCPAMTAEFALCFEGRLASELSATGLPVHSLGHARVRRPLSVLRVRQRLAHLLRERKFDLVVCHSLWPQAIFGPVVRDAKLPLVLWIHDAMSRWHWIDHWARLTAPDLVICNSQYTKSTLTNVYPRVKSTVIYCPVALSSPCFNEADRSAARSALQTPLASTVIIQVSRMQAWKGHLLHLDALSELRDLPDWICWQVGGAQRPTERRYLEVLQKHAQVLGIADRIRFAGEQQDIPTLLNASDIFCQPNIAPEPFGISFAEALLAGLPVVTTDMGGAKEIVDESCGCLVKKDAKAVAASLRKLIETPLMRATLGSNGPAKVEQLCSPKKQIEKLFNSLEACLRERAGLSQARAFCP